VTVQVKKEKKKMKNITDWSGRCGFVIKCRIGIQVAGIGWWETVVRSLD
jgi:hypothetical protein